MSWAKVNADKKAKEIPKTPSPKEQEGAGAISRRISGYPK